MLLGIDKLPHPRCLEILFPWGQKFAWCSSGDRSPDSGLQRGRKVSSVIGEVKDYVEGVVVIDDASTDETASVSREAGADVIEHGSNRGYLQALKTGFRNIDADVIVTLDADGEMDPGYIPDLVRPVEKGWADLVLGEREEVPRLSERFLSYTAGCFVNVEDTGTGYSPLRKELAERMELRGVCPCGTFVLEASNLGADISEVPVVNRDVGKPRRIAWRHFFSSGWFSRKEWGCAESAQVGVLAMFL